MIKDPSIDEWGKVEGCWRPDHIENVSPTSGKFRTGTFINTGLIADVSHGSFDV